MDSVQNTLNQFDFGAQVLCLDFANTANWHASPEPEEGLNSYSDLVVWGQLAGILSAEQVSRLLELAGQQADRAQACLRQAVDLREAIYRIFSSLAAGEPVVQADLEHINRELQKALVHAKLAQTASGFDWKWEEQPDAFDPMLWPVIRSAGDLLVSEQARRVGRCQDDRGCGYLFLDTSRNRSRRWCSMEFCGNRAKAQRHYGRTRRPDGS